MSWQRGQDHDGLLEGITMSEPIKPALTAEEWKLIVNPPPIHITSSEAGAGIVFRCSSSDTRSDHAIAALALYGQPFGFTRDDVSYLRFDARQHGSSFANQAKFLEDLADRIEALLPPG